MCVRLKPGGENEEVKGGSNEKIVDQSAWANGYVHIDGSNAGKKAFGPYSTVVGPADGQESAY